MLGGRSIHLVRVFGIRIGVHPSWFVVLFLLIWSLSGAYEEVVDGGEGLTFALATLSALLFFASVLLHELGHALVAVRNGIGIAGIDLWLFGGVAKMRRDTSSARVEFKVAIAGPLVTLAIAALCVGAGVLVAGGDGFLNAFRANADLGAAEAVLGDLALINAVLLAFNLIPGLPLDGGRLVRALAWWRTGDRMKATRFAARLGRFFAYLMAGFGLFLLLAGYLISGLWLGLIGLFLAGAARAAELQTRAAAPIEGLRVADVMDAQPVAVQAETDLERALEEFFLRYRWAWFPVVDRAGRFLGVVTRDAVDEVPEGARTGRTVDSVMASDDASSLRVGVDEPLEAALGSEGAQRGLQRHGAVMVVDADGVLRGVVTLDRLSRALRPPSPAV